MKTVRITLMLKIVFRILLNPNSSWLFIYIPKHEMDNIMNGNDADDAVVTRYNMTKQVEKHILSETNTEYI